MILLIRRLNILRILLGVTLILLFAILFAGKADASDLSFKWWKHRDIIKALNLSDRQINQIDQVFNRNKGEIISLNNRLKRRESELNRMINSPNTPEDQIFKASNNVESIRGDLRQVRLNMRIKIRSVLTPKQRKKLLEIRSKYNTGHF